MRYLVEEDELYHWNKGEQSRNHKYIKRILGKNGKWQYIYPGESYKKAKREAYLEKSRASAAESGYGRMNEERSYRKAIKASKAFDKERRRQNEYDIRRKRNVADIAQLARAEKRFEEAHEDAATINYIRKKNKLKADKKVEALNKTRAAKNDKRYITLRRN